MINDSCIRTKDGLMLADISEKKKRTEQEFRTISTQGGFLILAFCFSFLLYLRNYFKTMERGLGKSKLQKVVNFLC